MFVLDSATRTLEVLLDAAPATSQLPVVVTYADVAFGGATPYLPASSNALTNGVTAVTAVAAPAAGVQRQVEELTVRNDDTAARVVTLRYNDAGTFRRIVTATLQAGETLEYTHAAGLRSIADGAVKMQWAGTRIANGSGSVTANSDGSITVSSATNIVSFKNGTNPQEVRVYNTDTGGTADEWGAVRWNAGVLELGSYKNGTGANRDVRLAPSTGVARVRAALGQECDFYLEADNGAKTGFWAIDTGGNFVYRQNTVGAGIFFDYQQDFYFRANAGANIRLHLDNAGNLTCGADNAQDWGAAGASRPRSLYLGTSLELEGQAWVRNHPGRKRLTANVTNATVTFSNLADLTVTLVAGRKYTGRLVLKVNNSTAAEGVKLDFNGGSATMTSFWAVSTPAGTAGSGGAIVAGTMVSTSLAGAVNYTTITGETLITVELSMVVNVGGTFIPRAAENSHSTGTLTAELGSHLWLEDSPN